MKNDKIVTIKGKRYDSVSGMPISRPVTSNRAPDFKKITDANSLHSLTQKSHTLYRRATQKPIAHSANIARKVSRNIDVARSKSIAHFAKNHNSSNRPSLNTTTAIASVKHPLIRNIENKRPNIQTKPTTQPAIVSKPLKTIKEEAINEALNKTDHKPKKKMSFFKRRSKFANVSAFLLAILIFGGIIVYHNIPGLSVHIAGAQAGIKATYPSYSPDGFSLNGPVIYSEGNVKISFRANTGNGGFIIEQSKSTWDSTAVKNKVEKDSKGEFLTTEDQGLTIFTYGGNAAWVNAGILYTISGDAHLNRDQIRRIATSL